MPKGMSREESKSLLMEKAAELKQMAEEYDIPMSEIMGDDMGDDMMGDDDEMESSPDIDKAVMMMKAMEQ